MGESRAGVALGGVELGAGVRQGEPMGARGWVLPVWRSHAETCRLGGDGRRGREGRSMSLQVLGMIFPPCSDLGVGSSVSLLCSPRPQGAPVPVSAAWLGWGAAGQWELWDYTSKHGSRVAHGAEGERGGTRQCERQGTARYDAMPEQTKGHGHKPSQPKSCPEHAWASQDTRFAYVPTVLGAPDHPQLSCSGRNRCTRSWVAIMKKWREEEETDFTGAV